MNGEIEKERNKTTGLLIINLLIWLPLLIILFIIFGVSQVNAESYTYRQRVYDDQDSLINQNTSSGINGNGKALKFYTNISRDSSIPQGQFMNIYLNYAVAYRFSNANVNTTIRYIENILYVYNNQTYDITDSCTRTQVIERESGSTNFNRFSMTVTCSNIPTQENINAILIVSRPLGNGLQMAYANNVTYALQVNDVWFKSTSETNDTDKILINNNENFNKLMEENSQNTDKTIEAINNINQVCSDYNLQFNQSTINNDENGYFTTNGQIYPTENYYHTTDYYKVTANKTYTLTLSYSAGSPSYILYNKNKEYITGINYNNQQTITITPTQDGYIRFSYNTYGNTVLNGEYCYNALSDWNSPSVSPFDDLNYYDAAQNSEMDLIDEIKELSWNDFDFDTDTTSLDLVWVWLSRLLLENLYVKAMIMTLLTLGVIKLVLNR